MEITRRSDLNVGMTCNLRCKFCYYQESLPLGKDKTLDEIKRELRFYRKFKKDALDITGGEATIRKDILSIVQYAKEIGFKDITIITNAIKLSDLDFAKKLVGAGVTDFLVSVHAANQEEYEALTGRKGGFNLLMKGIENIKKLDVGFRTNTTITKMNYESLPLIGKLLLQIKPDIVNFISFNPIEEANKAVNDMAIKFSEMTPYLFKTIDLLDGKINKINVRYVPFCFMRGYEKYVCNCYQVDFDQYEWDSLLRDWVWGNLPRTVYHLTIGTLLMNPLRFKYLNTSSWLRQAIIRSNERHKVKDKACRKCRCRYICDGLHKEYYRTFGAEELKPIPGAPIYDPLYYKKRA